MGARDTLRVMSSGMRFPGRGSPPVDDRIVAPGSRAEIIEGKLVMAPPADEKHAVPHADLAYVLRAHVRPGYLVAIDMLTRTSEESDFAPDASVYQAERVADTGARQLEELAFEIVSEQALAIQTTKARELTRRGVRRVFCLVTRQRKLLEWSRETDAWSATPTEAIDDRCFVQALPASSLLVAATADDAVMRAMRAKGHPAFAAERAEGREEGREEGLRVAISDLCESLEIALDAAMTTKLSAMSSAQLAELRLTLRRTKRWPK